MDTRKYLRKYIHHRNYLNKGNQEFTFIRHTVQMVALVMIAMAWIPKWAGVTLGIIYLAACWTYGLLWDKYQGYDEEIEWSNKRNPTIQHIKRKV